MTGSNHGRRLQTLGRKNAGPPRNEWLEAVYRLDREERERDAVRTIIDFAMELAGTRKPRPPRPAGGGNLAPYVPEPSPPPSVRRLPQGRVWTKDVRPGPHDVLTWEEAMRVPWYDPYKEDGA